MRILVIEDNVDLTRQIKSTLEHALYVVDVAFDGEEGLFLGIGLSIAVVVQVQVALNRNLMCTLWREWFKLIHNEVRRKGP